MGGGAVVLLGLWLGPGRSRVRRVRWSRVRRVRWSPADAAAFLLGAVAIATYQVCFFAAVRTAGVAVGTVVTIGSGPVFTGLFSRLIGASGLSARWAIATAGAIVGCSVLVVGGSQAGASAGGVPLALAAGACYGACVVASARLIAGGRSERQVMAVMFGGGAALLLPVLLTAPLGWLATWHGLAVICWLGGVTTAAAYLLYGYGLRTVAAPVAVTLGLAEPAIATVLAVVLLGERLTALGVGGLLAVGVALAVMATDRRAAAVRYPPDLGENHERESDASTQAGSGAPV